MDDMNMPRLDSVRTERKTYAENAPVIAIAYSRSPRPGEEMTAQKVGATITIDANGGASSKLLVTLTETSRSVAGVDSDVTTTIDGTTVLTLKGLVDAINAVEGFTAWVTDAPHSLSTNTDTWLDLAETNIPENPSSLDCLKRSVSTANPVYVRVGEPTDRDAGYLKLIRVNTQITSATAAVLEVGQDRYGEDYKVLNTVDASGTTAATNYFNERIPDAPVYQGPLLITYSATALTGAVVVVATQNKNY